MWICPTCLLRQDDSAGICPADDTPLLSFDAQDPLCGQTLHERYLVLQKIGQGGMGVVYRAWQTSMAREVALKVIAPSQIENHAALNRFRREARLTASLQSPHTITTHDFGSLPEGGLYLVMELLDGRSLQDVLTADGRPSLARSCELLIQICRSLEEAHKKGIVHRDLKPSNIMLVDEGSAGGGYSKVLDFGLARLFQGEDSSITRTGMISGSPAYMSPEMARGEEVGPSADLYSLGILAYRMLVGRLPFEASTPLATITKHLTDRPPPLEPFLPNTQAGRRAATIVSRCLEKRPEGRYRSVEELRTELEVLADNLQGQTSKGEETTCEVPSPSHVSTEPQGNLPEPGPTPRKHPRQPRHRRLVLLLLAVAGLAAGLLLLWMGENSPGGPRTIAGKTDGQNMQSWTWPDDGPVQLLVVPYSYQPSSLREAETIIWPLAHHMTVNALVAPFLVGGGTECIDPVKVDQEIMQRGLFRPLKPEQIAELGLALEADLVITGNLRHEGGEIALRAKLHPPKGAEIASFEVTGVDLPGVAVDLAQKYLEWEQGEAPSRHRNLRLDCLLLTTEAAGHRLSRYRPGLTFRQRAAFFSDLKESDPTAIGPSWYAFLEDIQNKKSADALAERAGQLTDEPLRKIMTAISSPDGSEDPCAGLDPAAVGRRWPEAIGPLAQALCLYRKGAYSEALHFALEATRTPGLRPWATRVVVKLLNHTASCEENIGVRRPLQELLPEAPLGWAALANWYAKCGQTEKAHKVMKVARYLLADDGETSYWVYWNSTLLALLELDLTSANSWLAQMERVYESPVPDYNQYTLKSLLLMVQGRYRESQNEVLTGMNALVESSGGMPGAGYTMLAISRFYGTLGSGNLEGAKETLTGYEEYFGDDTRSHGDQYWISTLELVLAHGSGKRSFEETWVRMQALGDALVRDDGERGQQEREAQECLFLTHYDKQKKHVRQRLFDALPGNIFLGGCRMRHAELLLEEGQPGPAEQAFARALGEIVWARFMYAEFIPGAMLGRARALTALDKKNQAKALLEKMTRNFRNADRRIKEVEDAQGLLSDLESQLTATQ